MDSEVSEPSSSPEEIRDLFEACDLDGSGFIDRRDLDTVCGDLDDGELQSVFTALDRDGDGRISMDDFADGFHSVSGTLLAVSRRRQYMSSREDSLMQAETVDEFLGKLDQSFELISDACQESICELYQELHKSDAPHLLNQYEKVIFEVIKDIKQQQTEVNRLEQSLKRANDSHAAHLRQLESESEAQSDNLETRIREQEREKREEVTEEIKRQLTTEIEELENNLKKYQTVEARLQTKDRPRGDLVNSLRKEIDELRHENRHLRSSNTELQTNLALAKSENLELKSEYDDQMGFITSNRETLHEYIEEHENLTRQIELLHGANKKLQDTNDDLRTALDNLQKNARTPQSSRGLSRSSSLQSYDSRQNENVSPSKRRQYGGFQPPMESHDMSDLHNRNNGNYMVSRYTDADSIPDDVEYGIKSFSVLDDYADSGNSTLRDPNEVLDLEADEDSRRPPPITEEITADGQGVAPVVPQGTPERMYKIVLAGDAAVGKSSFILRLCKGIFHKNLNSTLGVDFQVRTMDVDGRITSVQLWDTAGQERFRSIAKSYFRRADGVLLLYDCTFERSFINVRDWIEAVEDGAKKPVPVMICANKVDLRASAIAEGQRCVRTEDGMRLATSFDALFIETSAKDNCNIEEAVIELVRTLHKNEDMEVGNGALTLSSEEIGKRVGGALPCCN